MNAFYKDIFRTIKKEKKRFIAIMIIVALGVTMLTGLQASCDDLRSSANQFYNSSSLHDFYIQSTLGISEEDLAAIKNINDCDIVEGIYNETAHIAFDNINHSVEVRTYSTSIDTPEVIEGKLPEKKNEVAVTEKFINETGYQLGDTISMSYDEDTSILSKKLKITGIVYNVLDINATEGATSFRSTATTDFVFFVSDKAVDSDIYTAAAVLLTGSKSYACYKDSYEKYISDHNDSLVALKNEREKLRTEEVKKEATDKVKKAEKKANKKFKEAEEEFSDAKDKLDDAKKEIADSKKTIAANKKKLQSAQKELDTQKAAAVKKIKESKKQISDGYSQIEEKQKELDAAKAKLDENAKPLKEQESTLKANKAALEAKKAELEANGEDTSSIDASLQEIEQSLATLDSINQQYATLESAQSQLNASKETLEANEKKLNSSEKTMNSAFKKAQKKIDSGNKQLAEGEKKLQDGEKEYQDGLKEYQKNYEKYIKEKNKALKKIEKAKKEIKDIDDATWYITTRNNLSGYSNVASDASAIESLGVVFSVVFLIVAVLISLTTMNRMVEEDRGLIGAYQALGFKDHEILAKYCIYALSASIAGCILGDFVGYIILPKLLFNIFDTMYNIPSYHITFSLLYGFGAPCIFIISILLAVIYTCTSSLKHVPASLMRPKAPKAGSRVLLERIPFIWKRLSFLNKVTVRNLFRYKKRLFMTIIGILGCTSLLVTGFAIKDTVNDLMLKQYNSIIHYDVMAVSNSDEFDELEELFTDNNITKYKSLDVETVTIKYKDNDTNIQLYVFDTNKDLDTYLSLKDIDTNKEINMKDNGIYVTRNASIILGFSAKDTITLQNMSLIEKDFTVNGIIENYLGNSVYMTRSLYEKTFGTYQSNAVVAISNKDKTIDKILDHDIVLSSVKTKTLKEQFSSSVVLINMVVYILILVSAALAFVVLFTLSTTNISERERELATIKVLGFFDNEVHLYVNKETMILTCFGIILGLPSGYFLVNLLTPLLKMPSLYFAVSVHNFSYVISIILTLIFSVFVNYIMGKTLNAIDPVEALKSIE